MGRTRWLGGLVLAAAAAGGVTAQDADYDLRGPAPEKGQVLVRKATHTIKDARLAMKAPGGVNLTGKQTLVAEEEEEIRYLAVDGRQVTRTQTRVIKDHVKSNTELGGNDVEDDEPGELEGELVIGERGKDGKWTHKLVDTKPTPKQKKELAKRIGPESDDVLYPAGRFKVGHAWSVDAAALQRVFGGSITDLKGKLDLKFLRVEDVGGEPCAVIESKGKVSGVAKEDEGDMQVEMDLNGLTWRSLKTGVDVKDRATGRVKMSGKVDMDGTGVDLVLEGPMTIDATARLKPAAKQ